jgi:prepilin-type N-terminal cleavage/methylation domain-containing protein
VNCRHRKIRGFTLVELLVVIAIIGILVALLLPAIQAAREAARRSQCINNMKQFTIAALNYENAKKQLPKLYTWLPPHVGPADNADIGFHIYLLPYMEYQSVYDTYDFTLSWGENTKNGKAGATNIPELLCPTAPSAGERALDFTPTPNPAQGHPQSGFTDYAVDGRISPSAQCLITGTGIKDRPDWSGLFTGVDEYKNDHPGPCAPGPLKNQSGKTTLKQTIDGLSHTVMFTEDAGRPDYYKYRVKTPYTGQPTIAVTGGRWASPDQEYWSDEITSTSMINVDNDNEIYSFHAGGAMFSFGDGSVHFVSDDTDLDIQISIITRAGEDSTSGIN